MRSNSRNVKLTGLLPGKEYEIAVKVVGDDGRESPWSIRDIVPTPPGTVTGGTVAVYCVGFAV
ncbi:hypothetical protein ANCDUO_14867 [Ancylostoma duodenale]|uniref:Fibronectin type-III domain-containing protein n=1 Tax=Ancylostoma duodenale TaxID=51022 RepID=A0A0C2G203_9BILA|nr:hypothetical protein ANCDUO_14867 [Ancylostoma duodenale]